MIRVNIENINQIFLDKYYQDICIELEKNLKRVYKKLYISNNLPSENELKICLGFFNMKEFKYKSFKHERKLYNINVAIQPDQNSLNTKFHEFIIGRFDNVKYYKDLFESFNFNVECLNFIKQVMDYEYIIKEKSLWFKKLDLKVCPYCNRQFIQSYKLNNKKKEYVTYQLDHFYNKADYYYLSLSFFNLVPSCNNCNLRKSKIIDELIYPYEEGFGQIARFNFDVDDISIFYGNKDLTGLTLDFKIDESEMKDKISNSINVFNLKEVYNGHKDIVVDLISKSLIYNKAYIDRLISDFGLENKDEFLSKIFFEYSEDELLKYPFSKLHNDVVRLLLNQ